MKNVNINIQERVLTWIFIRVITLQRFRPCVSPRTPFSNQNLRSLRTSCVSIRLASTQFRKDRGIQKWEERQGYSSTCPLLRSSFLLTLPVNLSLFSPSPTGVSKGTSVITRPPTPIFGVETSLHWTIRCEIRELILTNTECYWYPERSYILNCLFSTLTEWNVGLRLFPIRGPCSDSLLSFQQREKCWVLGVYKLCDPFVYLHFTPARDPRDTVPGREWDVTGRGVLEGSFGSHSPPCQTVSDAV